jgi:hypothetical protein
MRAGMAVYTKHTCSQWWSLYEYKTESWPATLCGRPILYVRGQLFKQTFLQISFGESLFRPTRQGSGSVVTHEPSRDYGCNRGGPASYGIEEQPA